MTTEFGERLKAARKFAKLTQVQLAKKAGLSSQGTVSELEKSSAGSSFTPQLAAACRVDPHWLATGDGDMQIHTAVKVANQNYPLSIGDSTGVTLFARDEAKPHTVQAWPFEDVDKAKWDRLTERQKGRVEAAMNAELARIESEQKQANSVA